jgi:hypothetical protein
VTDAAMGGPDAAEAEAAQDAVSARMDAAVYAMREIRAQSLRGVIAKARVADLLLRQDGEVHSTGPVVWMVVDDLLAMGEVRS